MTRYGGIEPMRRGFCGVISEDFFDWLREGNSTVQVDEVCRKKVSDSACTLVDRKAGVFFKRVCFCQISDCGNKPAIETCQNQNAHGVVHKCGHYAIILSNTADLTVAPTDFILDFTYIQMLYKGDETPPDDLPPYYFARVKELKSRTARWNTEYKCPPKYVVSTRGGAARRYSRRRYSRRRYSRRRYTRRS